MHVACTHLFLLPLSICVAFRLQRSGRKATAKAATTTVPSSMLMGIKRRRKRLVATLARRFSTRVPRGESGPSSTRIDASGLRLASA